MEAREICHTCTFAPLSINSGQYPLWVAVSFLCWLMDSSLRWNDLIELKLRPRGRVLFLDICLVIGVLLSVMERATNTDEYITILSLNGRKLCRIYFPEKHARINVNEFEKWVWVQSYLIKDSWNKLQILASDSINKNWPPFKINDSWLICYCLVCEQPTIRAVKTEHPIYFWHHQYGFICDNKNCPSYKVFLPNPLFHHIEEIPNKFSQWINDYIGNNDEKLLTLQVKQLNYMLRKQIEFPPK